MGPLPSNVMAAVAISIALAMSHLCSVVDSYQYSSVLSMAQYSMCAMPLASPPWMVYSMTMPLPVARVSVVVVEFSARIQMSPPAPAHMPAHVAVPIIKSPTLAMDSTLIALQPAPAPTIGTPAQSTPVPNSTVFDGEHVVAGPTPESLKTLPVICAI